MGKTTLAVLAAAMIGLSGATSAGAAPIQGTGLEAAPLEFARGGPDRRNGEGDPFKELRQNKNKGKAKSKSNSG